MNQVSWMRLKELISFGQHDHRLAARLRPLPGRGLYFPGLFELERIMSVKSEVSRHLGNMSSMPGWHLTMNKAEVEFMFSQYSGTVICNGRLRTIHADPITDNCFKVYTRSFA